MLTYSNRDINNGYWEDDNRHGRGVLKAIYGDMYNGEWKDVERHGLKKRKADS